MYKIILDKKVLKDLKKIDKKEQIKIIDTIENKLANDSFIGNYRIIYSIYQDEIIKIGHRKDVYEK